MDSTLHNKTCQNDELYSVYVLVTLISAHVLKRKSSLWAFVAHKEQWSSQTFIVHLIMSHIASVWDMPISSSLQDTLTWSLIKRVSRNTEKVTGGIAWKVVLKLIEDVGQMGPCSVSL